MNIMNLKTPALRGLAERLHPSREPDEVLAHIAWSVLAEPGDGLSGVLREVMGAEEALGIALSDATVPGVDAEELREGRSRWLPRAQAPLVHEAASTAARLGSAVILPGDADWPARLGDLGVHAPAALWVRGDPAALVRGIGAVSIVGARAATAYGEHMARELSAELASGGILIVSGGAYGIDGAAHRAALGVDGATVAFLAGGIDRTYPAGHAQLFTGIMQHGAIVSEVPCGTAPTKWRFLARNRLIGAVGAATVVVEAGWRSGSLNTAGHAADLGRPLGAVPGPVTSAASAGCHRLLREYDARCITGADDVRELIGLPLNGVLPLPDARDHDRTRLCDALSTRTARSPLEIARRSGLSPERVEAILGILALEGAARRDPAGWRLAQTSR